MIYIVAGLPLPIGTITILFIDLGTDIVSGTKSSGNNPRDIKIMPVASKSHMMNKINASHMSVTWGHFSIFSELPHDSYSVGPQAMLPSNRLEISVKCLEMKIISLQNKTFKTRIRARDIAQWA